MPLWRWQQVTYVYNGTEKTAVVRETTRLEITKQMVARPSLARGGQSNSDSQNKTKGEATTVAGSSSGSSSGDATSVAIGSTFGVSTAPRRAVCCPPAKCREDDWARVWRFS